MTKSPLKVLFLSSQVAHFLPSELLRRGYDVRIFTPKYGTINEGQFPMKMVASGMNVPTGEVEDSGQPTELICNIKSFAEAKKGRPTTYFLENMEYFEKRANVYGYS